jgi:hypothetical protein
MERTSLRGSEEVSTPLPVSRAGPMRLVSRALVHTSLTDFG